MRKILTILMAALLNLSLLGAASAADFGSKDEAKAMTEKAVAFFNANGKD